MLSAGSPADKAGIKQGDIIIKFDGKTVDANTELSTLIAGKKAGDSVPITVWRDGKNCGFDSHSRRCPKPINPQVVILNSQFSILNFQLIL